jgi:hypothetical protein
MSATSRILTKVIKAAAVALVVELADVGLEKSSLSRGRFRVVGKILKAAVAAGANSLLDKAFERAAGTTAATAGSRRLPMVR